MNFFGVGVLELVLVAVVAVIVLGPERMPEAAVQLARAIRHLRGFATSATSQLRSELEEQTRDYEEVRRELQFRYIRSVDEISGIALVREEALLPREGR